MAYGSEDRHFNRLTESVEHQYRQQSGSRKLHRSIVTALMGHHYRPGGVEDDSKAPMTAINLLSMASQAMLRSQVSRAPRVLATTADPALKGWAERQELAVNERIRRSHLGEVLTEVVRHSHVSVGILFMGPEYVGDRDGLRLELVMEAIDRADFVYDGRSRRLGDADFQGDKFSMKVADVREHPLFDERCRQHVTGDDDDDTTAPEDERSHYRRAFGRGQGLYDYCTVWRIYDRPRRRLVYFPRRQPDLKLLEQDWVGPPEGPYGYLGYEYLPSQAMPVSPLMKWLTLHRSYNALAMKAIHQQQVAKGLMTYTAAGQADAERVLGAVANQAVLRETGQVAYANIGGAAPDTVAMRDMLRRDFGYATGGIVEQFVQQASTLGTERLLRGATNELLADLGAETYRFVKEVCGRLYWWDLRDPSDTPMMLRRRIPGTNLSYRTPWSRQHREFVRDMEFEVDVEPYSYVDRTPQERLADLLAVLQILMGMMDQMVAQGITLDVEAIIRTIAKLRNMPELYDWLILNQEPERLADLLGSRGGRGGASMEAAGPRRYIRESESDGTAESVELMRMMRGGGRQGAGGVMTAMGA